MTEVEAIERIKDLSDRGYPMLRKAKHMAITALKEIQQYRMIKDATIGEIAETLEEYAKIGTVEECREAVDRQKPKKPVKDKYHHNCCSNCGWIVSGEGGYGEEFCPHCENCGQAIQWSENLEEMEDDYI